MTPADCAGPKREMHYWASVMPRKEAQRYLLDLCGSESQDYTENPKEVTCERCLAALRADSGAASASAGARAPESVGSPGQIAVDPNGVLDRAVRAAVLEEREEIVETVQAVIAMHKHLLIKVALRQLLAEIRRRGGPQ